MRTRLVGATGLLTFIALLFLVRKFNIFDLVIKQISTWILLVSSGPIADIILSKHRNGPIGDVQLKFKEESAKFVELDALKPLSGIEPEGNGYTIGSKMNQKDGDTEPPY